MFTFLWTGTIFGTGRVLQVLPEGGDHLNLSGQKNALMFAINSVSFYHQEWWGFRTWAPITGFQAKFWRHSCPAPFQEPHWWFSVWHRPITHTGLALLPPHTHCSCSPESSRMGNKDSSAPGALVWHTQLPKGILILKPSRPWCIKQTKQGAAASWKLHAAAVGWSSSTVWAGGLHLLISYPSFLPSQLEGSPRVL